jgi:flagellar hook-associated protein 2
MAGTISFGGIGSGLDTEGIVNGLVSASSGALSGMKSKASAINSAVSTFSEVGSLLGTLKSALAALSDTSGVKSYSGKSSSAAMTVSASATAAAGQWTVNVLSLAKEQRTYTDPFASRSTALGQTGTLTLKIGAAGTPKDIAITSTDTLDDIATKINGAGLRLQTSILYDGSSYRLQVRGLDSGAANAITIGESGSTLGLTKALNTKQAATDSQVQIDGFVVSRPTNKIDNAIAGVSFTVSDLSSSVISVEADPAALTTKLQSFVSAYNAVVNKVHVSAGFGTTKASNPILAGDSTMRGLTDRLASGMLTTVTGAGALHQTLGSLGVSLNRDGTLALDSAKLTSALVSDPDAVVKVLAGASGDDGAMDVLSRVVDSFNQSGTGLIASRKDALAARAKTIESRLTSEQARLDRYANLLRKQFQAMDQSVSTSNNQTAYLNKFNGT